MTAKIAIFILMCSTATSTLYFDPGYQPISQGNQAIQNITQVAVTPIQVENQNYQLVSRVNQVIDNIKPVILTPELITKTIAINQDKDREQIIAEAFDRVYKKINAQLEETRLRNMKTQFNEC